MKTRGKYYGSSRKGILIRILEYMVMVANFLTFNDGQKAGEEKRRHLGWATTIMKADIPLCSTRGGGINFKWGTNKRHLVGGCPHRKWCWSLPSPISQWLSQKNMQPLDRLITPVINPVASWATARHWICPVIHHSSLLYSHSSQYPHCVHVYTTTSPHVGKNTKL